MYKLRPYILLCSVFFWNISFAQMDISKILEKTNVDELNRISQQASARYNQDVQSAQLNSWPMENFAGIDDFGNPQFIGPANAVASNITGTTTIRSSFGLSGNGFNIGLWEPFDGAGYYPDASHEAFGNRIVKLDGNLGNSGHSTNVAGTLGADPPAANALAKGMAPEVTIRARTSNNHTAEMASEAANGLLVSNHSYATLCGYSYDGKISGIDHWTWYGGSSQFNPGGEDPDFGKYDATAQAWDELTYNAPYYLVVKSAGNDGGDNPTNGSDKVRDGTSGSYITYNTSSHPAGDRDLVNGDYIPTFGVAKNILTVGALDKSKAASSFTSIGPTDDGRIKPDIMGIGEDLYTTEPGDLYGTASGTSMAGPNVAGSLILLQEYYEEYHGSGNYMISSLLKGLVIHTAEDFFANSNGLYYGVGPDIVSGWGWLNADDAADIIGEDGWSSGVSSASLMVDQLTPSNLINIDTINVIQNTLEVTLCWTERAGNPNDAVTNSELRNNLNLVVERLSDGTQYLPIEETDPNVGYPNSYPVVTAVDNQNNVEKIYIHNAQAGLYSIKVSKTGGLYNNENQEYALVVSGLNPNCHYAINHDHIQGLPGGSYNAISTINSSSVITSVSVNYIAPGAITLEPGFLVKANAGSKFTATNGSGCN